MLLEDTEALDAILEAAADKTSNVQRCINAGR